MIEKSKFVEAIDSIRFQLTKDIKSSELMAEAFGVDELSLYDNEFLIKSIISLLQIWFPLGEDNFCEISHYCFCLNFGKPSPDSELETTEMFYDRLTK